MDKQQDIWKQASSLSFENEAAVEARLVIPLLRALGYSESEDINPKYPIVFREGRRGRKPEADFVVFAERPHSRATSLLTVEVKPPWEDIKDGKEQGQSYAANVGTPILLVTNGKRIEIWQYQVTLESECLFEGGIADLLSPRGKIELILRKEAVIAYSKTLRFKSFGLLSRDFGVFEKAEFERIEDQYRYTIDRTLKALPGAGADVRSFDLLSTQSRGALILGPSGYGKTAIACSLRRQAIEQRWIDSNEKLPLEIFLPDLFFSRMSILEFVCDRISAFCPQISLSSLKEVLRDDGLILICDGYDRVHRDSWSVMDSQFATLMRDHPKCPSRNMLSR